MLRGEDWLEKSTVFKKGDDSQMSQKLDEDPFVRQAFLKHRETASLIYRKKLLMRECRTVKTNPKDSEI